MLLIVDLCQYCVCYITSGVIRCTALSLQCSMYQWGLHAVLWSYFGILMLVFAAEPRITAGPLFPSQCPYGTILLTLYSMLWDWRVAKAGPMLFYWPKLLCPFLSSIIFFFLFFLSIGWYCVAGVFLLILGRSLSPSHLHCWPLLIIIMISPKTPTPQMIHGRNQKNSERQ